MISRTLTLICLALAFTILVIFDYFGAVTLHWRFMVFAAFLGILIVILDWVKTKKKNYRIYIPVFFLSLLVLRAIEISPVKPFKLFYLSLHSGLTQSDPPNRLQVYFPEGGKYKRPSTIVSEDGSMVVVLDPDDNRYNSEIIHISFQNGRIKSTAYYPD